MTTQLATAAVLTGILIYKVYRRRHPLPPPKVPHTEEWAVPHQHRMEVCKLFDAYADSTGSKKAAAFAYWEFVAKIMEEAGYTIPPNHSAKPLFKDHVPYIVLTEKLEDKK